MNDIYYCQSKFISCYYSDRLLTKLALINTKKSPSDQVNLLEIKKAIYYAKKYHNVQKRQSGEPFYSHPLEVAYMVADCCFNTNLLVTSILHDTIEDTSLTKEIITQDFNFTVGSQVEALTRLKKDKKIDTEELIRLLFKHTNCDKLLLVKYFDRVHNIKTINFKPPAKRLKSIQETLKNFISIELHLKLIFPNLLQYCDNNIATLCHQHLPSKIA